MYAKACLFLEDGSGVKYGNAQLSNIIGNLAQSLRIDSSQIASAEAVTSHWDESDDESLSMATDEEMEETYAGMLAAHPSCVDG